MTEARGKASEHKIATSEKYVDVLTSHKHTHAHLPNAQIIYACIASDMTSVVHHVIAFADFPS